MFTVFLVDGYFCLFKSSIQVVKIFSRNVDILLNICQSRFDDINTKIVTEHIFVA